MSFLTNNQIKHYYDAGYVSPIEVLTKDEAKEIRREIEIIEKKWPIETNWIRKK